MAENKKRKLEFMRKISAITIAGVVSDSDRGNLYRGIMSNARMDQYVAEFEKLIVAAYEVLERKSENENFKTINKK